MKRKYDLWFTGFYYFVLEPLFKQAKAFPSIVLTILRHRSPEQLFLAIHELRYILSPSPRCSVCGLKTKIKWIPILEHVIYPDTTSRLFEPVHIKCKFCDPMFQGTKIYGDIIIEEHGKKIERGVNQIK